MSALDALDSLSRALQAPANMEAIGGMAAEMIRGHLHEGKSFAPLSPATAAYRGSGRPLQDTAGLRDSITHNAIDGRTVSVGTNKPYAAIQNSGGVIRAKNKEWLWIPGPGLKQAQRKGGHSVREVLDFYKSLGFRVYRRGRAAGYNDPKKKTRNAEGKLEPKFHVLYYLKKTVEIPARKFFYLTDQEMSLLMQEAGVALNQF